jgi:hypothetical protein
MRYGKWVGGRWYYFNDKGQIVYRLRGDDEDGSKYGKECCYPQCW